MAQGGCPRGDGTGGPGYFIRCECRAKNARRHFRGSISMAHGGTNTGGSQFFLTFVRTPDLDGNHTVFGRVTTGQDVVDSIQQGDQMHGIAIEGDTTTLFESQAARLAEWNRILDG